MSLLREAMDFEVNTHLRTSLRNHFVLKLAVVEVSSKRAKSIFPPKACAGGYRVFNVHGNTDFRFFLQSRVIIGGIALQVRVAPKFIGFV